MAGGVPDEEHPAIGRLADPVGNPVALVADRVALQVVGQPYGWLLDVEAGIERADPDPHLLVRREAPAVSRGHVGAIDPDLHVVAVAARMHLETARQVGLGRLDHVARAEHAAPAKRVDDERRSDLTAIGDPRWWAGSFIVETCRVPSSTLAVSNVKLPCSASSPRIASGSPNVENVHGRS